MPVILSGSDGYLVWSLVATEKDERCKMNLAPRPLAPEVERKRRTDFCKQFFEELYDWREDGRLPLYFKSNRATDGYVKIHIRFRRSKILVFFKIPKDDERNDVKLEGYNGSKTTTKDSSKL